MKFPKADLFLLLLAFLALSVTGYGQDFREPPPKPAKETSLYDYIGLLEPGQARALEQKLIRYSDTTSTQIVLAIFNSTDGEDIDRLKVDWGQEWGIGQEQEDNGVVLLVAKEDRKVAIGTGYGVEGTLTDAMSKRIIEGYILPRFREGDFYAGLDQGTDAIFQVLTGEFEGTPQTRKRELTARERIIMTFVVVFFVFWLINVIRGRRGGGGGNRGRRGGGLDIWDIIILSSSGRGGGSFGGGSSGGFGGGGFGGGFGGGGFGGGGASGGW